MAKPVWRPEASPGYVLCRNCGWRLAKKVRPVGQADPATIPNESFCAACEALHGGQPPRTSPEKRSVRLERIQDGLIAAGYLTVFCKACGVQGHRSADCPTRADTISKAAS